MGGDGEAIVTGGDGGEETVTAAGGGEEAVTAAGGGAEAVTAGDGGAETVAAAGGGAVDGELWAIMTAGGGGGASTSDVEAVAGDGLEMMTGWCVWRRRNRNRRLNSCLTAAITVMNISRFVSKGMMKKGMAMEGGIASSVVTFMVICLRFVFDLSSIK